MHLAVAVQKPLAARLDVRFEFAELESAWVCVPPLNCGWHASGSLVTPSGNPF